VTLKADASLSLDLKLFNFISRFCELEKVIAKNIPLGLVDEDQMYKQERFEHLYECTVKVMQVLYDNMNAKLQSNYFLPS
jgi:hypothetical protein